jgi:polysaccharide deacetylase 2 family uncharacterized protein YibQ
MAQARTKKKPAPRKRPVKKKVRRKKKKLTAAQVWRYCIIFFLAALLLGSMAAAAYFVFLREAPSPDRGKAQPNTSAGSLYSAEPRGAGSVNKGAVTTIRSVEKKVVAVGRQSGPRPKVAIVIDDMGYRQQVGEQLMDLQIPLSFAFLPYAPYTKSLAEKASSMGRDVLLHLPMEPVSQDHDPGPGALYTFMNKRTLEKIFEKDLAAVPGAVGVNNHMGSRFTEDRQAMATVLGLVKMNNLFFLDSVTSSKSVGAGLAVAVGVKTARRHVFLDHEQDKVKIAAQLKKLLSLAEEQGQAVGIAHPHPETLAVLREELATLSGRVNVVSISRLLY